MTTPEQHVKINGQQVAGIDIPVSRVRACLDSEGLNRTYDHVFELVENLQSQARPLSELDAESATILAQCMTSKVETIESSKGEDADKARTSWASENEYEKALSALRTAKVRISFYAVVVLATAVDTLVHDLGLHAVQNTVADGKINITIKHLLQGIENTTYYPLFSQLPSFFNLCNGMIEIEDETPEAEDVEHEEEVDDEITAERKRPRHMNSFMHYISLIVRQHVPVRSDGKKAYRVTSEFKRVLNLIVKDFISNRVSNFLLTFLEVKDTKTVNESQVVAAIKLMLKDTYIVVDSTPLISRIDRSISRIKTYYEEYKECKDVGLKSGRKPEDYIATKDPAFVPLLPVETPKEVVAPKPKRVRAPKATANSTVEVAVETTTVGATVEVAPAKATKPRVKKTPNTKKNDVAVASA